MQPEGYARTLGPSAFSTSGSLTFSNRGSCFLLQVPVVDPAAMPARDEALTQLVELLDFGRQRPVIVHPARGLGAAAVPAARGGQVLVVWDAGHRRQARPVPLGA